MGDLRPIRTEAGSKTALAEVEQLWGASRKLGRRPPRHPGDPDRRLRERALSDGPPDLIDAIRFRMEQQGLSRKDLEGLIGTRTRVAEVLNRRRGLSVTMIRRLHEGLASLPRC